MKLRASHLFKRYSFALLFIGFGIAFTGCNLFDTPSTTYEVPVDSGADAKPDLETGNANDMDRRDTGPDLNDASQDPDTPDMTEDLADMSKDADTGVDVGVPPDYCGDYLTLNPVGYWPLNTANANDSYENVAASDGFPPLSPQSLLPQTQGHHLNAIRFDAVQTAATIPHAPIFEVAAGTISMWVKRDAGFECGDDTSGCGLFSKDAQGYIGGGHLTIGVDPGNLIHVRIQDQSTSYEIFSATPLRADIWEHVVLTFGSTGMRLYLNGTIIGLNNFAGGLTHPAGDGLDAAMNSQSTAIGYSRWQTTMDTQEPKRDYFGGVIDEILLFDRQLTNAEITQVYNSCP